MINGWAKDKQQNKRIYIPKCEIDETSKGYNNAESRYDPKGLTRLGHGGVVLG
jgi:hypothetical protein